jgi:endo-1,4-beta-mannosidase
MTSWIGAPGQTFLLGINYWPRSSAMAMWNCFDRAEIRADFARISGLGLHAVRFFLSWEAFQPAPDRIDQGMLDKLQWFMEEISRAKLLAMPTFFSGHMSGVNWLPAWTLDRGTPAGRFRTISDGREEPFGIGDFYVGELLEAQCYQARTVGEQLRDHPAIVAWDLGNEFSNMREPRSAADAATWSSRLSRVLHDASGLPITGGTHGEDITRDRNLRLSTLCAPWAFATMHGYSVYSDSAIQPAQPLPPWLKSCLPQAPRLTGPARSLRALANKR